MHQLILKSISSAGHQNEKKAWQTICLYRDFLLNNGSLRGFLGPNEKRRINSRHILDSLSPLVNPGCLKNQLTHGIKLSMADFGTGPGLPGAVLSIVLQYQSFTFFDSQRKRLDFIDEFFRQNDDQKSRSYRHCRIEDESTLKQYRATIDLAFSRAFLPAGVSIPLVAPYLKEGGHYCFFSGRLDDKLRSLIPYIEKISGLELVEINSFQWAGTDRNLLVFKKNRPTTKTKSIKVLKADWKNIYG